MNLTLKQPLIVCTLLLSQTVIAQPISKPKPLTLEQGLLCLDWNKREQSFNNQLSFGEMADINEYDMLALRKQFKQQYSKQKNAALENPNDDDFCDHCPATAVYLPKNKNDPIKQIETLMQVSVVGASTSIYRSDEIIKTKQTVEDGLNIKFSSYTGQQYKSFKQQWDKVLNQDDENRTKTKKLFQKYPHLNIFNVYDYSNERSYSAKQIFVYSQPYKRNSSDSDSLTAFITLFENPLNTSQHILQCGFIDGV